MEHNESLYYVQLKTFFGFDIHFTSYLILPRDAISVTFKKRSGYPVDKFLLDSRDPFEIPLQLSLIGLRHPAIRC